MSAVFSVVFGVVLAVISVCSYLILSREEAKNEKEKDCNNWEAEKEADERKKKISGGGDDCAAFNGTIDVLHDIARRGK